MLNSYSIKTRKSYFPSHSMTNEWKNALICVMQHFYFLHKLNLRARICTFEFVMYIKIVRHFVLVWCLSGYMSECIALRMKELKLHG